MKTYLIKPNAKVRQYGNLTPLTAIEPPLWLLLMSNLYSEPYIIDAEAETLSFEEIREKVKNADEIKILATGSHPSAHIQQLQVANRLKDYLGRGEVLSKLTFNPIEVGNPRWFRLNMQKYRAHNWHTWGKEDKSYGAVFSSISCPYTCEFCCVKDFYGSGYKKRHPLSVVTDIKHLHENYNITNFKMMDEIFAFDNKNVHDICDSLVDSNLGEEINIWAYARIDTVNEKLLKKLRKAGVRWLAYGIETGNKEIRKKISKGKFTNKDVENVVKLTKDCGINVVGNFMFGFEDDTLATMRETLDFAKLLNCEYSNFYCTVAYPGSKLYDKLKSEGVDLPVYGDEFAQLSYNFKPLPTKTLTAKQVLEFRDCAFIEYHTSNRYLGMIEEKFGEETVSEIIDMVDTPLLRKHRDE